jgi:hypothetical protein
MTRRRHQVFDARGRPVDDDVVPDGGWVRTPMWAMDGVQREIAADAKRRRTTQRDPQGRLVSTYTTEEEEQQEDAMTFDAAAHRPGYRTSNRVNDDEAVKAYNQYVADQANAWRKYDAQKPVTREDAAPTSPVFDAAEGQRIKDAAWAESVRELENAWRGQKR